jgi:hypothetical protein
MELFCLRGSMEGSILLHMDAKEYKRLYKKIEEKLKGKCKELEHLYVMIHVEQHNLVNALNTLWRLENDNKPHPAVADLDIPVIDFRSKKSQPIIQSNGNGNSAPQHEGLKNRNDVVRHVVRRFDAGDEVTAQIVMAALGLDYPDVAQEFRGRTTMISKVLRLMEEKGELEKVKEGVGFKPTIYRRAEMR